MAESSGVGMFSQELFLKLLCLERKRTDRSGRRFVLMLADLGNVSKSGRPIVPSVLAAIAKGTRDTDLKGWYKENSVIGVIFTEIGNTESNAVVRSISTKVTDSLYGILRIRDINEIKLSFHIFPEDWDDEEPGAPATAILQMALTSELARKNVSLLTKRLIDVAGSIVGLLLSSPMILLIAAAIKATSRGPVFYRQVRLGQYGKQFTFLKFRSMYINSDHKIHEEYVNRFITGAADTQRIGGTNQQIYKLTADPRITPVGRFLRNTSLDEVPQFLNVLRGDMSLVGPRPPVPYEFKRYDLWHRQRLVAVKPGLTGLWQVDGRSRVKFDEMVRLDIRYARSWSLWLDLKILLQTPHAVISGAGAC